MNYIFEFNSSAIGRIQPFEYSYAMTNEYAFTYSRDIFSDLSKFNAPIFVGKKRRGVFPYDKTLFLSKPILELELHNNPINLTKENSNAFTAETSEFVNKEILLGLFQDIFISKSHRDIDLTEPFFFKKECMKISIANNIKNANIIKLLEVYDNNFLGSRIDVKLNLYQDVVLNGRDKEIDIYKTISLNKPDYILSIYKNYFVERPIKQIIVNHNFMVFKPDGLLFINNPVIASKPTMDLNIYKQIIADKFGSIDINVFSVISANTHDKEIFQIKELPAVTPIKELTLNNKMAIITKQDNSFYMQHRELNSKRFKNELSIFKNIASAITDRKGIILEESFFARYADPNNLFVNQPIFAKKDRYGFSINDTEIALKLSKKGIDFSKSEQLFRNELEFSLFSDKELNLYEIKKGFIIDNFNKTLELKRKELIIREEGGLLYKNKYGASINIEDVNLAKLKLPLNFVVYDNTIGFIVSEKDLYLEKDNQILDLSSKKFFSSDTTKFLDKEQKQSTVDFGGIFIITEQKKTFLEYYHDFMLSKNAKQTLFDIPNQLIEKSKKDGIMYNNGMWITKGFKEAFIEKQVTLLKKSEKTLIKENDFIFLNKGAKNTITVITDMWLNKVPSVTNLLASKTLSKDSYEVLVENDNIFVNKAKYELVEHNAFIGGTKSKKDIGITQDSIPIIKSDKEINVDDYIFIDKQHYIANPYVTEMKRMEKIMKDLEKPVEKTYNWVYVYQYDDPIDPNYEYYGLDELLLPEKDVDYSSFIDVIFDKETMTPKKPVKIIDDNTFIAKYPIKHPTPDYEDIGIVYIDVPTDLMYEIFMKFYQIWYANIFKFGNMSMVDSLKLMLDYIYSFIVVNYSGTEYLEPALRVFRQIRWFGETSVMHNAQYKITYEYQDLKSNLQTGECQIKNELSGFAVNTDLKVLSTEPTSIGQEAYIKLYAPNKVDAKIYFSVSFTSGNLDVYINDDFVDTIYSNHAQICYELPPTDTENVITLKRSANVNNGYCYIGNIIITNGTYKNLHIEYDPELKAGNMPLNDIVNKMVILANMYDNEQEVFEKFRRGNLAISELYKELENYWELHHANKIKGKRLTIKET